MKDERLYLSNIQECIERIEEYTKCGKEEFMATKIIQDAVIRNFEIIGEATKRWLFGTCYAKLLATPTKQYYKMYQQISKSAVRVDI